ncbi:MAG TPA: GNAT family N-acetyltransferase [Candidatus Binataceae bacterium]
MVVIERASNEDFEHICALDETVVGHGSRRAVIARAVAESRCAVARADGAVRGFQIADRSFFGNWFVELLIVHPDYRRRGVASALMRAAELDCPAEKLFTSTNQSNFPMQQLCARLGFIRSGYVENLDPGDPEIIYVKILAPVPDTPPRDSDES